VKYKVAPLNRDYLIWLLAQCKLGVTATSLEQSYLSAGSVAYCLLENGEPVFAAGVVNMQWRRGEAWMLPTPFYHKHTLICLRYMYRLMPILSIEGNFRRIQATCVINVSTTLFDWLKFKYEGTLASFGPNGEQCHVYARLF
jgi:hypothetical protein